MMTVKPIKNKLNLKDRFGDRKTASVYLDTDQKLMHFFTCTGDEVAVESYEYDCNDFSDDFYRRVNECANAFAGKTGAIKKPKLAIVLPDTAVFTDVISVPVMRGKSPKSTLDIMLSGSFPKRNDLTIQEYPADKTKQGYTYFVTGVRTEIVSTLKAVCSSQKNAVSGCSYAAESLILGYGALGGDIKSSFIFLDVKDNYSRLVFVYKGLVIGSEIIPFGYFIFDKKVVVNEEKLYNHAAASRAVIGAYEFALSNEISFEEGVTEEDGVELYYDKDSKKIRRRVLKDGETTEDVSERDIALANYKSLMRRVLAIIKANPDLTAYSGGTEVRINIPERYDALVDGFNMEIGETGVSFSPVRFAESKPEITDNLELFGAQTLETIKNHNTF